MITLLTSPKEFIGDIGRNQIAAIKSWKAIHSAVEIILYGKSNTAYEVSEAMGLKYVPDISSTLTGLPFFNAIARHAKFHAKYDVQIYLNADIMLNNAVITILKYITFKKFLIVGQRIDLPKDVYIDLNCGNSLKELRRLAERGVTKLHAISGKDYFIFSRGLWDNLENLVIGRGGYDTALIAFCLRNKIPIVDATLAIPAIHLYHEYKKDKKTGKKITEDQFAMENIVRHDIIHSGPTIADADWLFKDNKLHRNYSRGDWIRYFEIGLRYRYGLKICSYWVRALWRIIRAINLQNDEKYNLLYVIRAYACPKMVCKLSNPQKIR